MIIGAHFDAWPDGALDPGGATSILLQLAHTFNEMYIHQSTLAQLSASIFQLEFIFIILKVASKPVIYLYLFRLASEEDTYVSIMGCGRVWVNWL